MTHRSDSIRTKHKGDPTRSQSGSLNPQVVSKSNVIRDVVPGQRRIREKEIKARGLVVVSQIAKAASVKETVVQGWLDDPWSRFPKHVGRVNEATEILLWDRADVSQWLDWHRSGEKTGRGGAPAKRGFYGNNPHSPPRKKEKIETVARKASVKIPYRPDDMWSMLSTSPGIVAQLSAPGESAEHIISVYEKFGTDFLSGGYGLTNDSLNRVVCVIRLLLERRDREQV